MKKIVIIIIALVVASGSAYAVYEKMEEYMPEKQPTQTASSSSAMRESSSSSSSSYADKDGGQEHSDLDTDTLMESSESSGGIVYDDPTATAAGAFTYSEYKEGIIRNGKPSVLFFKADWCPECHSADLLLQALYKTSAPTVNTYKINYDKADALKKQYGVVSQDTFILIDGKGAAEKTLHFPIAAELKAFVSGK